MLNHSTFENTQPLLLSMSSVPLVFSPLLQIFYTPNLHFPLFIPLPALWSSLIFLLLLQIVDIKCWSLCFCWSLQLFQFLRCSCMSFHMCISARTWWSSRCKATEVKGIPAWNYKERQTSTVMNRNFWEKTSFSRNQKRRGSSVFLCSKEGERTNFWLNKSKWQRADNIRYLFHVKYFSCRYWGEMKNSWTVSSETPFLDVSFVKLASWTFVFKRMLYNVLKN